MDDLQNEVILFVSRYCRVPKERVDTGTRLLEDLGMDGDDGIEFFEDFSRRFEVDLSDMDFCKHFGPEAGWNPVGALFRLLTRGVGNKPSKFRDLGKYPITINHLTLVAEKKRWFLPERAKT